MAMPGRKFSSSTGYRYTMNGQEKDEELFEGAMSAEYWEYDARTGRRWNADPVDYPCQSSYACFNNNPIYYSDPLGLEGEGWEPNKKGGYTYNEDPSKGKETADWTGGDINGHSYDVHGNKEGSLEVTYHTIDVHPKITDEERFAYSRNTSRIMNDFSKGLLIGAVTLPAAIVAAPYVAAEASLIYGYGGSVSFGIVPAAGSGYLANAALRTSLDLAAQTTIYGGDFSQVDVGDGIMSGLLTPFGSAIFGGAIDYKPFQNGPKSQTVFIIIKDKSIEKAVVDASLKFTFSSQGYIGSYSNALASEFAKLGGKNLAPIVTAPFNLGGKLISNEVKKEIFK